MAMKFMSQALIDSMAPKHNLVAALRDRLRGKEKPRSLEVIHASDITSEEFCPRRVALLDLTNKAQAERWIQPALRVTFDMGRIAERLLREEWLGDIAVGNWRCEKTGEERWFSNKPQGAGRWRYVETPFFNQEAEVQGSPDLFVDLGAPKLFVVECKIMAADEWDKIVAPLAEHRIRTNLYMRLIDTSKNELKDKINVQEARVLYVSRGYGRMHPTLGEILPFKEFVVKRDDVETQPYWKNGLDVKKWRTEQVIPVHKCATLGAKLAQKCPVAKECFSGTY